MPKPASDKIAARLFVDADLGAGGTVGLERDQAHYLRTVLRLKAGARLLLFNGRDGEWSGRLDAVDRGWASVALEALRRPQMPEPDLRLLFVPVKRARIDYLAQKATELGVSVLQPVWTAHAAAERVNLDRLAANAVEAAEQCERLTVPAVRPDMPLQAALDGWDPAIPLLVCAEAGTARPIAEVLAATAGPPRPPAYALLVGPEGGFAAGELDALRNLPFCNAVGLGPRVLRADTAVVAGLACIQAICGDGAERPPFRDA